MTILSEAQTCYHLPLAYNYVLVWNFARDVKKKITISYPCVMLNVDVALKNTNDQYQVSFWSSLCVDYKLLYEGPSLCGLQAVLQPSLCGLQAVFT